MRVLLTGFDPFDGGRAMVTAALTAALEAAILEEEVTDTSMGTLHERALFC